MKIFLLLLSIFLIFSSDIFVIKSFCNGESLYSCSNNNNILSDSDNVFSLVILDAGHGGADCGAIGVNDVYEKDLNLSTVLMLRDLCELAGFDCVLTRSTDDDTDGDTLSFNKTADIYARRDLAEKYPDSLFVSIHMNYSTGKNDRGFQVFYGINGEAAAAEIHDAVEKSSLAYRMREVVESPSNIYLMKHIQSPAVLVECGFISNEGDAELLYDNLYREKLSLVLFSAIFG